SWKRALDEIAGGWEIAGNAIWESGRPITFYSGANTFSSDVQTPASCFGRCDPNMGHNSFDASRNQQFFLKFQPFNTTTNCTVSTDGQTQLCIPAPGQTSNIGRNFFRQGINANLNAMIGKTFRVTEV